MDKIKLVALVGLLLIGAGCTTEREDAKISSANDTSFVFDKKVECRNLRDKIEKEYNSIQKDFISRVTSVFYSPRMNSCLFTYKQSEKINGVSYHFKRLEDFLNGKTILGASYDTLYETDSTRYSNFEWMVKEYE